jgi:hemerythrin
MEYIRWTPQFSVGIGNIDKQHQSLFKALNDFYNGLKEKKSKEALELLLNELKEYTIYHFSSEENLLKRYNYPAFASHKAAHDYFVNTVDDYIKRLQSGKLILSIEVTEFLKNWLENHILKVDKEYAAFFEEKGIKL